MRGLLGELLWQSGFGLFPRPALALGFFAVTVGESEAAVARGEGESEAAVTRGEGESEAVVSGHVCCIELTATVPTIHKPT